MTMYTSIDGAVTEITSWPVGIDGAVVELDSMYAGVDGATVKIFSKKKKIHNPVNSVTVTGTYSSYASNYGAAVTEDGKVVIYTKFTYSTEYEDVDFETRSSNPMVGDLVYRTYYRHANNRTGYYYFAVFDGITEDIDVTLNFPSRGSRYDYVICYVSSTTASSGRDYEIPNVNFTVSDESASNINKYDVAYCENGDIILLATTTSYASTNTPIVTVDGLTLIDAKGYSQQIYYSTSYLSGIFGAIITGFTGGAITMLVKKPSNKLEITLTAS